jgi:hypothetical protein
MKPPSTAVGIRLLRTDFILRLRKFDKSNMLEMMPSWRTIPHRAVLAFEKSIEPILSSVMKYECGLLAVSAGSHVFQGIKYILVYQRASRVWRLYLIVDSSVRKRQNSPTVNGNITNLRQGKPDAAERQRFDAYLQIARFGKCGFNLIRYDIKLLVLAAVQKPGVPLGNPARQIFLLPLTPIGDAGKGQIVA